MPAKVMIGASMASNANRIIYPSICSVSRGMCVLLRLPWRRQQTSLPVKQTECQPYAKLLKGLKAQWNCRSAMRARILRINYLPQKPLALPGPSQARRFRFYRRLLAFGDNLRRLNGAIFRVGDDFSHLVVLQEQDLRIRLDLDAPG